MRNFTVCMDIKNPFLLTGYHSPQFFCDRKDETEALLSSIDNGRNVTLVASRRMGKTGLIQHVFYHLKGKKNTTTIYIDIMPTQNLPDFISLLSSIIIGRLDSKLDSFLKRATKLFSTLRPQLSMDPLTGEPFIDFSLINSKDSGKSIDEVFNYLKEQNQKQKIVIAIDEFQQILKYPEEGVEALLRSKIQTLQNVSFIFSGSHKHMILNIFKNSSRPFYQSTELMHLEEISKKEYNKFIAKHFKKIGKNITPENINYILDWTRTHTYYVQFICNKLYGNYVKNINREEINGTLLNILKENEMIYYNYRNLLTHQQWKLLMAIGKEKEVYEPTGGTFIKKYDLHAPSTVKRAMDALLEKELVLYEMGSYKVYDVFFSRWLERL